MRRENSRKAPILMAYAAKARNAGVSMEEVSATLTNLHKKTVAEIKAFIRELNAKAEENYEDGTAHGRAFADAQRWAASRLSQIVR